MLSRQPLVLGGIILGFCLSVTPLHADLSEDTKEEIRLGRRIAANIAGLYGIDDHPELNHYVRLVGNTLAYTNGRPELNYYFAILASDEKNAFACPGGYIFVTKGLILSCKNEAELAGVLAHEIAHINYKHVFNAIQPPKSKNANSTISHIIGAKNVAFSVAFQQLASKGLSILLQEGLQHSDEQEADVAATFYVNNTGYNADGFVSLLKRLATADDDMSATHPSMSDRLTLIEAFADLGDVSGKYVSERFQKYVP